MLHSMLLVINVPIALLLLSLASHFTLFQTDSDCRGLMKLSTSSRGWFYVANTLTRYNIRHHVRYWIVNAAERSRTLGCSCVIVLLQRTQLAPTELHHCECVCVHESERERAREKICMSETWLHVCVCVSVYPCQVEQIHSPVTSSFCLSVQHHWEFSSQRPRKHTHTHWYQPRAGVWDHWLLKRISPMAIWMHAMYFHLSNESSP